MPDLILGIMSGSSLDALDMALCRFDKSFDHPDWELIDTHRVPYTGEWEHRLRTASRMSGMEVMKLDADYGAFIGTQVKSWLDKSGHKPDVVASHGHTVFHEPGQGFTFQVGSGAHIAAGTGIDSITTFRKADIALGGQGAPFAPIGDKALFPGYEGYLNLGGIANIHVGTKEGHWHGWDVGPCNQALNLLAAKEGLSYDLNGLIAASGLVQDDVVADLKAMYPTQNGKPYSISNAHVERTWLNYLDQSSHSVRDLLASTTQAIAELIVDHAAEMIFTPARILVTGGGAHNAFLMQRLDETGLPHRVHFLPPEARIIDFKECVLMAYLGYLARHRHPFGIYRITGASRDYVGGAFFPGKP